MSDTSNPGKLASAAPLSSAKEFDARLKRTDEDRWLATRYAPALDRERLVAIYLLHQELQRALHASEPMLGKIRIQWWRETLAQLAGEGAVRRHDLAEELARLFSGRTDLMSPLGDLVDRFDDILDDHLAAGGHSADAGHAERHLAAEAALVQLAGLSLDASADAADLAALALCGEARLAVAAGLPDAAARWAAARKAARGLRASLWPAIAHLAALHAPDNAPLTKRWRLLQAIARRRL